jgi:hypothetical protein
MLLAEIIFASINEMTLHSFIRVSAIPFSIYPISEPIIKSVCSSADDPFAI